MAKDYNKIDWAEKKKKWSKNRPSHLDNSLGEMYGVGSYYNQSYGPDRNMKTRDEHNREIQQKMNNDYSTREFLKFNSEVRDQLKKGIPANAQDMHFVKKAMEKMHKTDKSDGGLGNGGKFDNAYDRAGVAQESFDNYMSNLKDGLKQAGKKPEPEQTPNTPRDQYPISEEQARVNQREQDTFSGRDTAETFDTNYRADAAGKTFLDRYKMNFMPSKKGKDPAMVNRGLA